jgi:hypothetical protein
MALSNMASRIAARKGRLIGHPWHTAMIKLIIDSNDDRIDIEPNFNILEILGRRAPKILSGWGGRISCAGPACMSSLSLDTVKRNQERLGPEISTAKLLGHDD